MSFDRDIILSRLPHIRGRLRQDAPLARLSWFRTGGSADLLFEPSDEDDLVVFLKALPSDVPITLLGVGSNLLVRDGGVEGVVIRLGRGFAGIRAFGTQITAGAGAMDVHVARAAAQAGIAGLEFLVGVPGTIGGAVKMNAGAYGREMQHVTAQVHALDRAGHTLELHPEDLDFSYRKSAVGQDTIVTRVCLDGKADHPDAVKARMTAIGTKRANSQPIGTRTGGSTFKNPVLDGETLSAWKLVDEAGCRGLKVGGAEVSEKHTNFLINQGDATAFDIEQLGENVRRRVFETSGVTLEWEIKRIGRFEPGQTCDVFSVLEDKA